MCEKCCIFSPQPVSGYYSAHSTEAIAESAEIRETADYADGRRFLERGRIHSIVEEVGSKSVYLHGNRK
jgi:hypothetical protein